MKNILFLLLIVLVFETSAQDGRPYQIYDKEGDQIDYEDLIKDLRKGDVVLFGELHNNSIGHWLQLQVTKSLHAETDIALGAEMFEADNQIILDEYLSGLIKMDHLEKEAKVWDNFETDYKPLLEFAKQNSLSFTATNIPRRYANRVYREGLSSLETISKEGKEWIAPLPIEVDLNLPGYSTMVDMMKDHGENVENIAYAQAVKDATMAHFILENRARKLFIHFNGTYHSKNFEGISHYLKEEKSRLDILTIHMVEQESLDVLEDGYKNTADFIIAVPVDMTKTY